MPAGLSAHCTVHPAVYAVGAEAEREADVPPEVTSPVHGHVPTLIRLVRVRVRIRVSVRVQRGIPT